jgi:glycosyltransferase involved in cell wall biosynthesis
VSAAYDTRTMDGITHFILRVTPPLARLCELTVLTPDPRSYGPICRTKRIPGWSASGSGRLAWTLSLMRAFLPRDCDCVICPTPVAAPGLPVPVVTIVHDLTPLVMRRSLPARTKSAFWTLMQTVRWADRVVVDSAHTRRDLVSLNLVRESDIEVVHAGPGVEPAWQSQGFGLDLRPYVLYVGGHAIHKNVVRLIAAFARIGRGRELRLVLAGWSRPPLLARTEAAVRRYGIADQVTVLPGGLSDAQVSALYRNCSAFVYPSLYEGFGLPVLEAMAHGAPVACSRTSSLPEVGGDAVLYFDPHSTSDIAAKLEAILTDRKLESELRLRGRTRAQGFTWENTALGIYEAAIAAINRKHRRKCP